MKTYTLNNVNVTYAAGITIADIWYSMTEVKTWTEERLTEAGIVVTEPPVVEPQEPVVYIPTQVTMRQARLALHAEGLLTGINSAIEQMGEAAKIEWEYAPYVQRDNPLIAMVQQAYGMTDEQIDNLFVSASIL